MPVSPALLLSASSVDAHAFKISDLLAQINGGEPTPSSTTTYAPPKRKADQELSRPADKIARKDPSATNPPRQISQARPVSTTASVQRLNSGIRDGTKPSSTAVTKTSSAAVAKPSYSAVVRTSASASNVTLAPPGSSAPKPPPKKGSYEEIMARATAAQATLGQVGKIQHKKVEVDPMKRGKGKALQSTRGVAVKGSGSSKQPALKDGRNGVKENGGKMGGATGAQAQAPVKKVKKAALATTGYTGTARPNPALLKTASKTAPRTASKPTPPSAPKRANGHGSSYQTSKRSSYAREDDDDDMGEEEDYESDVSSDMEAAAFEVDEEEEKAARIARLEDEEAAREEARHKREKEEKRRKLAALAGRR